MRSKIARYCECILEAGWLLAVIIAPLFFNVYSDRVFEPDKISLVRSIALVMAAAWLTRAIDGYLHRGAQGPASEAAGRAPRRLWRMIRDTPLVLPTLLMVLAYIISTLFSVVPRISFWGSYQRMQGTYTTFSYIVIFFMVLSTLRRREQVDRLINTIVLASFPIAIYGILQHYQRDPLPWGGDVTARVASNMGNAIFVAAYLIMAFFLTLERLVRSFSLLMDEERGSFAHAVLTGAYMALLVAQLLAIFFTQSRGPWIGLLAGLYVFVLLGLISLRRRHPDSSPLSTQEVLKAAGMSILSIPLGVLPVYAVLAALKRGQRWMWMSWLIQAVFGVLFLIVFNIPNSPLAPLRDVPYIGRLGQVFEMESGTGRVRTLIWEGAVELLGRDPLHTLVGYGPESMWVAYNPVYPPELAHLEARNASPDRSHNETFDALITTGVIGFLAYIFLFGSIFYYGLSWLGLIRGRADRRLFIGMGAGGAVLGILLPWVIERSWRLAGVGLAAGFILGIIAYLTWSVVAPGRRTSEEPTPADGGRQLLLIALLATIVAHFIEIHFGIAIVATRVHFWVLAATMVAVGAARLPLEDAATPAEREKALPQRAGRKQTRRPQASRPEPEHFSHWASVIAFSLVVALILVICGYDYITNQAGDRTAFAIIRRALTAIVHSPQDMQTSYGILGLFVLTWIVGGMFAVAGSVASHPPARGEEVPWGAYSGAYIAITVLTAFPFILWHAWRLQLYVADPANHIIVPYVAAFLFCLAIALALYFEGNQGGARPQWGRYALVSALAGAALFVVAVLLSVQTNMNVVRADVYFKQGKRADSVGQWDASISFYQRSMDLAPEQDYYYLFLGRAQLEKAQTLSDEAQREELVRRSLATLEEARRLNPLNTDHTANLARLYRIWAQMTQDPATRQERFEQSLRYYEEATRLSPHNAGLYNEWGLVYFYMGQPDQAMEKYRQSLELDSEFSQTYVLLGDVYLAGGDWEKAEEAYRRALELEPTLVQAHSALGYVYAKQGRLEEAIAENERVLSLSPQDYISMYNLAQLYDEIGETDKAIRYAEQALSLAPEQARQNIEGLLGDLRGTGGP